MIARILALLIISIFYLKSEELDDWTWLLSKTFSEKERISNKKQDRLIFTKTNLPSFTQAIVSWNALRPKKGFFKFSLQLRDAQSHEWHPLHSMFEWGYEKQKSFLDATSSSTKYHYVRLEMPKKSFADGLRIIIEGLEGVDMSLLYAFFICINDGSLFKEEKPQDYNDLPSVKITGVPLYSQMILDHPDKDRLCSPTSCSMLLSYLLKKNINPVIFAQNAYDNGYEAYGSWPFNMAHAFELCKGNWHFYVTRLKTFGNLYSFLAKKIPVVVSVRGFLKGAPKPYNDGHLLIVVGWDARNKKVLCHDPAFDSKKKVTMAYDLDSFLTAWERSRRLAYIATPRN